MQSLRFVGLSKSYGSAPALRDVTLELAAGRVHALMGENGAGKSTLIKLIAGVVPADKMTVERDGQAVTLKSGKDATRAGFRFIHQELNVVPQLSVAENIFLARDLPQRFGLLINWRKLHGLAREALETLGITHIDPARQVGALSTVDRMLVRIASALVAAPGEKRPCLYVLDEPTAALSETESERLFAVIQRLKSEGAAILYVSHRMNEIMKICDDVTVLRDGIGVMTEKVATVSRMAIIHAMTGKDLGDAFPARTKAVGQRVSAVVTGLSSQRLRDANFSVREGEIFGIAGLSDAGQTELVQLFLGIEKVTKGQLVVLGRAVPKSPSEAWSRGIAYIPRDRRSEGLMLRMPIRANMLLPHLADYGVFARKGSETHRARDLARHVQLRATGTEQSVGDLSGGNQQKVVFARAMAGTPRLLLLDEPTRGVDVGAKFEIYTLIREMSAQGCSVLLASSDLPELLGLCDRIVILQDGRQTCMVVPEGMTTADLLARFYWQDAA